MIRILLALLFLTFPASAADRFWVGGTGTWNTSSTTHWSASSGGASGASVPGASDNAFFDASSGGGTVTMAGVILQVLNLDMSAAAAMTLTASPTIFVINGTTTLGASVTYSSTGTWTLAGGTFTSNGATMSSAVSSNSGLPLGDGFTSSTTLTINGGTFTTNNHNVTASAVIGTGAASKTWNLGSSTFTLTGTGTPWNTSGATFTMNAGTSTIKYTNTSNSNVTFSGNGKTYNNLWFDRGASTGDNILTGANTFNDLKDTGTAAHDLTFPASTTTTVSSLTVNGGSIITIINMNSSTPATQWTISKPSGTVLVDQVSIQDSVATGGATFNATNVTDGGNNVGWNFITVLPQTFFSMNPL